MIDKNGAKFRGKLLSNLGENLEVKNIVMR